MKKILLAVIAASALCAACHERKQDPAPDYDGARARSEAAHGALDASGPK